MSDPPGELDPAAANALVRQRICEDVTGSGFFEWSELVPVNMKVTQNELQQSIALYSDLFHRIYRPNRNLLKRLLSPFSYDNQYSLQELIITSALGSRYYFRTREFVFVCLLRQRSSTLLVPYYVSKEYNVSDGEGYQAGRFVFGDRKPNVPEHVILAEESAEAYVRSDFNVELHYLQMRKYRRRRPGIVIFVTR